MGKSLYWMVLMGYTL